MKKVSKGVQFLPIFAKKTFIFAKKPFIFANFLMFFRPLPLFLAQKQGFALFKKPCFLVFLKIADFKTLKFPPSVIEGHESRFTNHDLLLAVVYQAGDFASQIPAVDNHIDKAVL